MSDGHSISDVSRIARIPKDLLRMWERRYGYPNPSRDSNGDRVYSDQQLDKLILIRQLQEQGKRPGKLMGLGLPELRALQHTKPVSFDSEHLVALLKQGDSVALHGWFQQQLQHSGLRVFILEVMAPASRAVGDAWSGGELEVYQEHLFTELMKSLVRQAMRGQYRQDGSPRVMLTTVPGERHGLGLLMVEALLRLSGAKVISFGPEMPFRDIKDAAVAHQADVIGLSFSACFKADDAVVMLAGLRQLIDSGTRIWVGGGAFENSPAMPDGVELIDGLTGAEIAIADWNRRYKSSPAKTGN